MPYYLYRIDPSGSQWPESTEWPGRIGGPYRTRRGAERARRAEARSIAKDVPAGNVEELRENIYYFLDQLVVRKGEPKHRGE